MEYRSRSGHPREFCQSSRPDATIPYTVRNANWPMTYLTWMAKKCLMRLLSGTVAFSESGLLRQGKSD